jgi:hypothetical protein
MLNYLTICQINYILNMVKMIFLNLNRIILEMISPEDYQFHLFLILKCNLQPIVIMHYIKLLKLDKIRLLHFKVIKQII